MSAANLFINGEWKSALDGGTRELETKQININLNPQRLGWFSRL